MDERELIEKAKKGNSQAVGKLYAAYQAKGIAIARQYVRVDADAEDMYQDAFLKAMGALDRFDESKSFQSWLDVIIVNTCKDFLEKKRPVNFTDVEANSGGGEDTGLSMTDRIATRDKDIIPEEALDRRAVKEIMDEVLSDLPDAQREALVYYYYKEMSVKQIAETFSMPENTVKSNLSYARKKTRSAVEAYQKKHGVRLYSSPFAAIVLILYFRVYEGVQMAQRLLGGTATGAAAGMTGGGAAATGTAGSATAASSAGGAAGTVAGQATAAAGAGAGEAAAFASASGAATAGAGTVGTVAAVGTAAVKTGFLATTIGKVAVALLAVGVAGGATYGGIKIAEAVRENRAAETVAQADTAEDGGLTETVTNAAAADTGAEDAGTAELTAAVNEALDAGDYEAAKTLLTEAAEAGNIPEETLEELQLLATPVMTTRTITETENYDGRTNQYVENTTLEYDGQGRVIRKTVEGRTLTWGENPGTHTYEYDEEGRILRETFVFDEQNDFYDPYTSTKTYSYDAEGRLVGENEEIRYDNGNQTGPYIRSYTYDAAGNLVEEISFIDMNGDGVPQLPANGVVTDQLLGYSTYTYDAQGRIATEGNFNDTIYMATSAFDPARPDFVVRYEYDAAGRLVGKYYTTDNNTPYETYEYDADGFLLKKTTEGWDGYFYVTTETTYDREGNETGRRETGKVELSTEEPHYVRTATVDNVYVPMRDLVQNR